MKQGIRSVVSFVTPSPGLRDRVKSSQDFTFGHPLPRGERLGVRGQAQREINYVVMYSNPFSQG
jgi:hypothetical protein